MTIFEFEREALRNLKGKPLKAKLEHIATYYWIPIVSIIAVVSLVIFLSHSIATKKETVLFGYCINASENENSLSFPKDFGVHAQIGEDQEVVLIPNLRTGAAAFNDTMQALTIHVAAAEVDFIAGNLETCRTLVQYEYFCDLSEKLDPQLLEKLSPYLLYAERSELYYDKNEYTETPPLPTLTKAESVKDPVPVALDLGVDSPLAKAYAFGEGNVAMLIMHNAPHFDMLLVFLDYILP